MNMKPELFVSYALEDKAHFDAFLALARKENAPFSFQYFEEKDATSEVWRTECRNRINACTGTLVLITKTLKASEGGFWETKCALESGKPMLCIFAGDAGIIDKPLDLRSVTTMVPDWERIKVYFSR